MVIKRHIDEVALLVRDYDEAIAWFTQKLGFSLKADDSLPGGERWVTVGTSGEHTKLRLARAENAQQAAQIGKQAVGRVLCYLHTDDFGRDYANFLAKGSTSPKRHVTRVTERLPYLKTYTATGGT